MSAPHLQGWPWRAPKPLGLRVHAPHARGRCQARRLARGDRRRRRAGRRRGHPLWAGGRRWHWLLPRAGEHKAPRQAPRAADVSRDEVSSPSPFATGLEGLSLGLQEPAPPLPWICQAHCVDVCEAFAMSSHCYRAQSRQRRVACQPLRRQVQLEGALNPQTEAWPCPCITGPPCTSDGTTSRLLPRCPVQCFVCCRGEPYMAATYVPSPVLVARSVRHSAQPRAGQPPVTQGAAPHGPHALSAGLAQRIC
mmetsp:Transcript_20345/g.60027  ORF Transcript_20345/g.60027 Transcript_20345/m.60027 type:complete len:251 (-) Transcript_20345:172-924(-)